MKRAPARGRYDRTASPAQRALEQRERLIEAAADLVANDRCKLTVSSLVRLAGTGRNTFYEHFPSLHAVAAAIRRTATERAAIVIHDEGRASRTPIEQLRALTRAWFRFVRDDPSIARALEHLPHDDATSQATHYLCERLAPLIAQALNDGAISKRAEPARLSAAALALQTAEHAATTGTLSSSVAESLAVDLVLRLFR
jgi:AcrR family transcriptional regulator